MFHVPEAQRIIAGPLASDESYGNNGAFALSGLIPSRQLLVIASDGEGWEHVSCHVSDGTHEWTPVWDEMSYLKGIFWDPEDCVVEYHPPASQYINFHGHTLHLWRPTLLELPLPPSILVGPVGGKERVR